MCRATLTLLGVLIWVPEHVVAQSPSMVTATWLAEYRVVTLPPLLSGTTQIDIYLRKRSTPNPVVIWLATDGLGATSVFEILPWFEMGLSVVVVRADPSVARTALLTNEDAKRRIESGRCMLRLVASLSSEYGLDTDRVVLAGRSTTAYTALMAGQVTSATSVSDGCAWKGDLNAAAIVIFNPTQWPGALQGVPNRLNPLTYVRASGPKILVVHSDAADHEVSVDAWSKAINDAGGGHTVLNVPASSMTLETWPPDELAAVWRNVHAFLQQHGLTP